MALINWTQAYLARHAVESPRLDAEILLAYVMGCQRIDLYLRHDQPLHGSELARYRKLIQRRARREPMAYITGHRSFWTFAFQVDSRVLIPRPETESLVQAGLEVLSIADRNATRPARIIELGTGSGAVIISLAAERPQHRYFAMDRSLPALAVARKNASRLLGPQAIDFFCGSWFSAVHPHRSRFDLIVANPPYIDHASLKGLQPEIAVYEPVEALDGGPDGLDALGAIIRSAPAFLVSGGWLLLEIGHDQSRAIDDLVRGLSAFDAVLWERDLSGHRRVAKIRKKALHSGH